MKKLALLTIALSALTSCYSSAGNESIGQVKKLQKMTPIICPDYTEVHVSLGVMRNGVGSMSHEDIYLAVDNEDRADLEVLDRATNTGDLIRFTYDIRRVSPGWPSHRLTSVRLETAEEPQSRMKFDGTTTDDDPAPTDAAVK